jgi:hypothetical protein
LKVKSYYVPENNESQETIKKFIKIRWREHKSESELVMLAIKEYVLNHSDGNDAFTLDSFVKDPEMEATPALGKHQSMAEEYIRTIWDTSRRDSIHDFIHGWMKAWNTVEVEKKCQ